MLISESMPVPEKRRVLEHEFDIQVSDELEEGMKVMCNYSDLIEERGIKKGKIEGMIRAYYECGLALPAIAQKIALPVEEVKQILIADEIL